MRGKAVQLAQVHPAWVRITPRMCGEKPSSFFMSMRSAGSPPRMRGKGHRMPINVNQVRITPACAGKRVLLPVSEPQRAGSPPHVRGKDSWLDKLMILARITPACAGKSGWPSQSPPPHQDHPRMCGEKPNEITRWINRLCQRITPACAGKRRSGSCCYWHLIKGSPPHVRGKVRFWHVYYPARYRDHPRMCGEKKSFANST